MSCPDVAIIGAGVVGSAIGYGLARQGLSCTLLDAQGDTRKASRGNFGLVWVQGKGLNAPHYSRWSQASARDWPALSDSLLRDTGLDVGLRQGAGLHFCLTEDDFRARRQRLDTIVEQGGNHYAFQMLDHQALRELVPQVGPTVFGASYSTEDGHANPLRLQRALHHACERHGARIRSNCPVGGIRYQQGLFHLDIPGETIRAKRLVIAAGLANQALAAQAGIHAPVGPNRGHLLITQRLPPLLPIVSSHIRQTDEGTIQIGDSNEAGIANDTTDPQILQTLARRAIAYLPMLRHARIVRTWAALRVMTPDTFPIYQESAEMPGAFVVTCHSGITLAAKHAGDIAAWIAGGAPPAAIAGFSADRFPRPQERA